VLREAPSHHAPKVLRDDHPMWQGLETDDGFPWLAHEDLVLNASVGKLRICRSR
jgi:hypothetical protein